MADERLTLEVSGDGMSALLTVEAGPAAGPDALAACLARSAVVFGLETELLARVAHALADPSFTAQALVVARGRPAAPGRDAAFAPAFEYAIQPGHLRADGTMDFLDRELLKPVSAGTCLGRLEPASAGEPGRCVDGRELPTAAGEELALELGEGVVAGADGGLLAARAGVVHFVVGKRLDVVQRHEHAADVDLRSGHLVMEGSLLVLKSVRRPFQVAASGDIEIRGAIEGGSAHAGGSIVVRGGVSGGDASSISAAGDISLRHAERASVSCAGSLRLQSAVNCELSAAQIVVEGPLRGGAARAQHSIQAGQAGAPSGGDTLLVAGVPLPRPLDEVRRALDTAKQQRALRARSFGVSRAAPEHAKQGKRERAGAVLARASFEQRLQLAAQREMLVAGAQIEVRGTVYPGVTVRLGEAPFVVETSMSNVRFCFDRTQRGVRWERLSG